MLHRLTVALVLILSSLSSPAIARQYAIVKWLDGYCAVGDTSQPIDMEGATILGLYGDRSIGDGALARLIHDKKCRQIKPALNLLGSH